MAFLAAVLKLFRKAEGYCVSNSGHKSHARTFLVIVPVATSFLASWPKRVPQG